MKIKLYKNYSENHMITKQIGDVVEIDGTLRSGNISIVNPSIEIKYFDGLFNYNYAFIPEFGRYYYINDIRTIRTGIVLINLHCDVLMSFKDEFLQNIGYIETSMNYGNFYLTDPNLPIQQNRKITTHKSYNTPFKSNGGSFVMNCTNLSVTVTKSENSEEE